MIKKAITGLLVAGITVCLTFLAGNHYESYQEEQTVENEAVTQAVENGYIKQLEEANANLATVTADRDRILGECEKGEVAYEILTDFQRIDVPAPVCSVPEEEPVEEVEVIEEVEIPTDS